MKHIAKVAADPHHRLRSARDHANRHWQEYVAGRVPDADHAALHLAFYLASFGMYRGSSDTPYFAIIKCWCRWSNISRSRMHEMDGRTEDSPNNPPMASQTS